MSDPDSGIDVDQMISETKRQQQASTPSDPESDIDVNQMISETKKGPTTSIPIARPENDYAAMPLSEVAKHAAENFLPSAYEQGTAIVGAVAHPGRTISAVGQLVDGMQSKFAANMGWQAHDSQREAALDALGHAYAEKYGTMAGFKQALATDSAGVFMDLSAVASGGELAAAKVGSLAGKLGAASDVVGGLQKTAGMAGTVAKATNPLDPMGVVSGLAGRVFGRSTPPKPFNPSDTSELDRHVQEQSQATGFPHNDYAEAKASVANPAAFEEVLKTKGVSPATVREAYLKGNGMEATRAMATGEIPPSPAAIEANAQSQAANEITAGKAAKDLAGSTNVMGEVAPDPIALSQAHLGSLRAATAKRDALYDQATSVPGEIKSGIAGPGLDNLINNNLEKAGHHGLGVIDQLPEVYPKTIQAIKAAQRLGSGTLMNGGSPVKMDAKGIIATRKVLSGLMDGAEGSDINGVRQVLTAFDDRVSQLAPQGWMGGDGNDFVNKFGAARQAHASLMDTFMDPGKGNNAAIAQASKRLTELGPSVTDADHFAIGSKLGDAISHPKSGPQAYGNLSQALGGNTAPLDQYLTHDLLRTQNGKMVKSPEAIATQIAKSPTHLQALENNPTLANRLQSLQTSRAMSAQKAGPGAKKADMLHTGSNYLLKSGARLMALHAGSHFGAVGELAGLLGEQQLEHFLENWGGTRQAKLQAKGAPSALKGSSKISNALNYSKRPITSVLARNINDTQNREHHAAGGRAGPKGHSHLVERLFSLAEKAKKDIKTQTKPILNTDDNVVAKALAIAGKSI
jgi:hypothetical protein